MPVLNYFCFHFKCNAVDCQWNDWTIGTCSATCGDGTRTNTRTKKAFAAYGGEECNGPAYIQESCNIQACPGMKPLFILYVIHSFVSKNNIWIVMSQIWQLVILSFPNEQHLISAVHCVWDEWTEGSCSATCGVGARTNTRAKLVNESDGGTCTGYSTENVMCEDQPCPSMYLYLAVYSWLVP